MNLEQMRREYLLGGLHRKDLHQDPVQQFNHWFKQAIDAGINDPSAMTIATVAPDGQPSQRIVLLKQVNDDGFVFFTNLSSRKAQEIAGNNKVCLHFPWHILERQVIVYGHAVKLSTSENLKYFLSRPKESQLAAWASKQSQPIKSRKLLMQQFEAMKNKFSQGDVPLPDFWGGYRVVPTKIEFWQGGGKRLHDRFIYQKGEQGWSIERLNP